MKKDNKKALYESIMTSVAKEVKKALNEELDISNFNLSNESINQLMMNELKLELTNIENIRKNLFELNN